MPRYVPSVLIPLLCWVCLPSFGCGDASNAADLPSSASVQNYRGDWAYRYGVSPSLPDGALAWANPSHDDGGWQPTQLLHNPPGRIAGNDLWLRVRLSGPPLHDATLFLHEVDQSMEGFLDGHRIASFGPLDGPTASRFFAKRPLYLPLGNDYGGRILLLHFHSPHGNIGIIRLPRLGGRAELLIDGLRQGLPSLVVGMANIVLGLVVLLLYLLQRSERIYLPFVAPCLAAGPYLISRSLARGYLFDNPTLWRFVLVGCFCLTSAAIAQFVAYLFEGSLARLLRLLSWVNLGLFFVGSTLTATGMLHLESFFRMTLLFWLPFLVLIILSAFLGVWRGNADMRILAFGLFGAAFLALPLVLSDLDVVTARIDARALAGAVLLVTLGGILIRRFRVFNKRLADYSSVLQLSMASAHQMGSGEHAQVMLAELLRLLEADRAVLYQCKDDGSEIVLLAARNKQGPIMPVSENVLRVDERTRDAAIKKRHPVTRERVVRSSASGPDTGRESILAAPLMVQGQLLGVLYLEVAAKHRRFGREDLEILLGLGSQVALTLTAVRAGNLEAESTQTRRRLGDQWTLLQSVAGLAAGELQTPIVVPARKELAPLALALEEMRRDLQAKLRQLESRNAEVQQLNNDLRYQLDQRLQRVLNLEERHREHEQSAGMFSAAPGELLNKSYQIVEILEQGASRSVYEVIRRADGHHKNSAFAVPFKLGRTRMRSTPAGQAAMLTRITGSWPQILDAARRFSVSSAKARRFVGTGTSRLPKASLQSTASRPAASRCTVPALPTGMRTAKRL